MAPPAAAPSAVDGGAAGQPLLLQPPGAADFDGMHYSSEKLQEKLRAAQGLLRSARLPPGTRQEDFFRRFDEEARKKQQLAAQAAATADGGSAPAGDAAGTPPAGGVPATFVVLPSPPSRPPTPENLSFDALVAKYRRDVQRLERASAELRQEQEAATGRVAKEVLDRCAVQDEVEALQQEYQKARKAAKEVRDFHRRQAREIEELQASIAAAEAAPSRRSAAGGMGADRSAAGCAKAGRGAAKSPEATPTQGSAEEPGGGGAKSGGGGGESSQGGEQQQQHEQLTEACGAPTEGPAAAAVPGERSARPVVENQELASALEAVRELSQQLAPKAGYPEQAAAAQQQQQDLDGEAAAGRGGRATGADARRRPGGTPWVEPPPRQKEYPKVLASCRPKEKDIRLYIC